MHSHATGSRDPSQRRDAAAVTAGQAVLIVGHPGHELRLHGWLESVRPAVMMLTDGSGPSGHSRLASSTTLLERAGAARGPIYGRLSDQAVYRAVLDHDVPLFIGLVDEMADVLVRDRIDCVVGDGAEGYNPTHDICRLLVNTAVTIAQQIRGTEIANLAFPLVARPDLAEPDPVGRMLCIELDDEALERKLRAARAYTELADEVTAALTAWGAEAFRKEYLRFVDARDPLEPVETPYYERHGEQRVASGVYERVIRYHTHVKPLANALDGHARHRVR
jgi:hypothetical protein